MTTEDGNLDKHGKLHRLTELHGQLLQAGEGIYREVFLRGSGGCIYETHTHARVRAERGAVRERERERDARTF